MVSKYVRVVLSLLLFLTLGLLSPALSAGSQTGRACCTRYNRKPVPFQLIKGYREQTAMEHCHIEAIILHTVRNKEVCVTKRDEWVRKTLEQLSTKLKKMSKESSGAVMKKRGSPSSNDGSGSFFSTTDTDTYY